MNRHGTMKGRWKALLFGAAWFLLGLVLFRLGWVPVFAAAVPTPPSALEATWLVLGALLMVLGAVLGVTPHVIWLLRAIYKEDFARGAQCPVMLVCPTCAVYNPRGRLHCKSCNGSLLGARAAGGDASGTM